MDKKEKCDDERLDEIYKILGGSIDGTPGLVAVVQKMVKDVYDAERGVQVRLEKIENERLWLKGWLACAVALGGLIVWLVEHWK